MIGDDQPSPGIGVFHAMFSVALQRIGMPVSDEMPWPVGPRKRVRCSADGPDYACSDPGTSPDAAKTVDVDVDCPGAAEAFGKVMSAVKPRMAVAYHFFKDFDTTAAVYERIRSTYDGPLSLAEDYMVWNVTKDDIQVRLAEVDHHTWAPPLASPAKAPSLEDRREFAGKVGLNPEDIGFSDFTNTGFWDVDDVLRPIYEEASEVYGREFPYPGDK